MPKHSDKHTVQTNDGSLTMYSAEFDECYHSTTDGALRESLHKHVIPALTLQSDKNKLTILDICFGLGYNTLATIHHILQEKLDTQVHIISPEFDEKLVRSLKDFEYPEEFASLKRIIDTLSENMHYQDEQFRIDIIIGDARKMVRGIMGNVGVGTPRPTNQTNKSFAQQSIPQLLTPHSSLLTLKFDIIYQDAFSPAKNPTLWTREWFADLNAVSQNDAILTTYSIAATTRMGLHESDWSQYYYNTPNTLRSLIASPSPIQSKKLPNLEWIDMELKIKRNPEARSLQDEETNPNRDV